MSEFRLHPRLEGDTHALTDLALCQVRLMDDARFAWLILVPRRPGAREVFELSPGDQAQLWHEATWLGRELKQAVNGDKLNLATLGNQVTQLHLHVIVRSERDAAWPAPVWGFGDPEPYDGKRLESMRERVCKLAERLPRLVGG
ncbi:Diadenosine tetraphosphate (Ap4A) hydrolase [Modicisalibacter muralis]|uniref:Diadenosine tetraphosphate (Ap4A) hydrolase n=1 Tax=Modicisalibacter muralis TaxID=119000 RepID=A0A1G9K0Z1_9GAMM|nr:HIT family protein [Halomonas muralis]SDL42985.1 Diadenosine tetraphosphate (Ap4A) hydrolase [Halomonas muralis]